MQKLRELAPRCGYKTGNELAVKLVEAGVEMLETGEVPETLIKLRAALHGDSGHPTPQLREMVFELVQQALAAEATKKEGAGQARRKDRAA